MDDRQIADFLEELAESLSFQIRYEPVRLDEELGNRPGGVCLLKCQRLIIIDPQASLKDRIRILSQGIKQCDLNGIYIRPVLRELLEATPEHKPPVSGNDDRESDEKPIDVER